MKSLIISMALMVFSAFSLAELAEPKGDVILEVSGNIQVTNSDDVAEFDRDMINSIKSRTIITNNHVVKDPVKYEGPILAEILKVVKGTGSVVRVYALDDYVAELKFKDVEKYQIILATHEAGKQLTVADKGPLFVVFPFKDHPELQQDTFYNQSVWQVKAVEIE